MKLALSLITGLLTCASAIASNSTGFGADETLIVLQQSPMVQAALHEGSGFGECSVKLVSLPTGKRQSFNAEIDCVPVLPSFDGYKVFVSAHVEKSTNGFIPIMDKMVFKIIESTESIPN